MTVDLCVESNRETRSPPADDQEEAPQSDLGLPVSQRYRAVAGVWLALIVCVLDSSIANIALPSIAHDLATRPADSIAIVSAYQVGAVISLLPMAALGEIVTYRRVFLGGLCLFTFASLACVLSHDLLALVLSRAFQGVGAAGIMSVNGALARYIYPHRLLGAAMGSNALIVAAFGALGPTIASTVLLWGPWQWLFAINLPIGAIALALGLRTLPESPRAKRKLDGLSTALNIIAFAMLVSGVDLVARQSHRWLGAVVVSGGLLAAALLVSRSASQAQPLVPIDLLKIRLTRLSALTSTATFLAQTLTLVSLPFYFQDVLHLSMVQTGLLMTSWAAGVALAAPLAGWLADRLPVAVLGGCGLSVMATGLALLSRLPMSASLLSIGALMSACGVGFGFFQAPNNRAVMSSTPMRRAGAAAGLIAISRVTGQIIGAILAAILLRLFGESSAASLAISAAVTTTAAVLSFAQGTACHTARAPMPARRS